MIRSMTGFGRGAAEDGGARVEVELKGVNHRFLDLKIKLPAEIASLEPEIRARVQKDVGRGRIDLFVGLEVSRPPASRVEINRALVADYLKAAAALKEEFRLRGSLALESIVAIPGAVAIRTAAGGDVEAIAALLRRALDGALRAYGTVREEEGQRLARDLRCHLDQIGVEAGRIEEEARHLPDAYAARLRERVETLVRERGLDDVRLAQEVALLADRVDVTEEIVRLRGHLQQARDTLDRAAGPVGKTLDFVMQEMNREANTISSKADALPICQAALRIKSAVEKIREQVQNLE